MEELDLSSSGDGHGPNLLEPRWLEMIECVGQQGLAHWSSILQSGTRELYRAIYDLYNAKAAEHPGPNGGVSFRDQISDAFGQHKKNGQGPFYVFFNLDSPWMEEIDWTSEWRVYLNVNSSNAAAVMKAVIELATTAHEFRILQAKINREEDEINGRADGIVIYTSCEEDAKAVASHIAENRLIADKLSHSNVHMSCILGPGISVGESPKATQKVSFGNLRAAALAAAVMATLAEGLSGSGEEFVARMRFWLEHAIDMFGLSAQQAHRNGDINVQPLNENDIISRLEAFRRELGAMLRTLREHREKGN